MIESNPQTTPPNAEKPFRKRKNTLIQAAKAFWAFEFTGSVKILFSIWAGLIGLLGTVLGGGVLSPVGGNLPETCSFYASTHLPCPGCGLTRSVTSHLQGEPWMGFAYHPFGIVFAVIFVFCALSLLIPPKFKHPLAERLSKFDPWVGRLGIVFALLLIVFGVSRIFLASQSAPGFAWWKQTTIPPFAEHWVEKHGMPKELFPFDLDDNPRRRNSEGGDDEVEGK
ncbi:MAG: DUF2752 domain-containing protein [Sumerlaeia bacterium]